MTKTKLIDKVTVKRELARIIRENPDNVNPMDPDFKWSCLYHRGRGKNIKRCLIGQLGRELGLPTPWADDEGAYGITSPGGVWADRFTEGARQFMSVAQFVADGGDSAPRVWSTLTIAEIERQQHGTETFT